jgi:hypothetical protein
VVYRQWGEDFLAPETFPEHQQEVTVKLLKDAYITPKRLTLMRQHQSMRIDGPFFRGRPLGHRLDPLRCHLNKVEPSIFVPLVERLLAVHDYRVSETLNPTELLEGPDVEKQFAMLTNEDSTIHLNGCRNSSRNLGLIQGMILGLKQRRSTLMAQ